MEYETSQNLFLLCVNSLQEGNLGEIIKLFGGQLIPYGTRANWYFEEGKHVGTINDIAIHGIDLVGNI